METPHVASNNDADAAQSPPLIVENAESVKWDDVADVVVVGYGGAGVAAALHAREGGADVLAIDRFDGGGATAFSGGVYYGGNTRYQKDAGIEDDVDEMFKYLREEARGVVLDETMQRFCQNSSRDLDWLASHGVPYEGSLCNDKTSYPPDGKYLYYSGNERVPRYKALAKPAPRGHRAIGSSLTGHVYYAALRASADRIGVRSLVHAPARRLILDRSGAVIGIEVLALAPEAHAAHAKLYDQVTPRQPFSAGRKAKAIAKAHAMEAEAGRPMLIRARGGIVLATGGFINNIELVAKHLPFLAQKYSALMRLGSMGCDGSGIRLGQSAGGVTDLMGSAFVARSIAPPSEFLQGIAVNTKGERFINEDAYTGFLGEAIANQPEGKAWLILQSGMLWKVLRNLITSGKAMFLAYGGPILLNVMFGGTKRAKSPKSLARKLGLPEDALARTVAAYDTAAIAGTEDPAGKSPDYNKPLASNRLTALNLATGNPYSFTITFTLGGLVVDEETGGVRNASGDVISGLYAAGRTAVGLCSGGYISGMSIADTVFSGRRAAESALRTLNNLNLRVAMA